MSDIRLLLQPFAGYIDLGMYEEANDELENLPTEMKEHPIAWLARLSLLVEMGEWEGGVELGESLCQRWPDELEFWFKTAFCQHELKRTIDAKNTLLRAPVALRVTALFHYNLACYETQLGDLAEGKRLLDKACKIDPIFRKEAVDDPDLQPLRKS